MFSSEDAVINLKKLLIKKMELMEERTKVENVIIKGREFFYKYSSRVIDESTSKMLSEGTNRIISLVSKIEDIDRQIKDIDVVIISTLEMLVNNVNFKFSIPEHCNSMGDIIERSDIILTPGTQRYEELCNIIDPIDLWSIMLLKEMFQVENVEIINN